jgi:hypothetical protein
MPPPKLANSHVIWDASTALTILTATVAAQDIFSEVIIVAILPAWLYSSRIPQLTSAKHAQVTALPAFLHSTALVAHSDISSEAIICAILAAYRGPIKK